MVGRFKLDENLPRDAATLLAEQGHDVETVLEEGLGGGLDSKVLERSRDEERVLITLDLDFADIHVYPPSGHRGIWVLRHQSQRIETILELLRSALTLVGVEPMTNRLWIVEPGRVRIRD